MIARAPGIDVVLLIENGCLMPLAGKGLGRGATLFFLHLPRTGGTSLMQYLDRQFEAGEICPAHKIFEFESLREQDRLAGYAFYRGHFGINLPRLVDAGGQTITFLREPLARFFSMWRHLRSRPVPFQGRSGGLIDYTQRIAGAAHRLEFEEFCYAMMAESGPLFLNSMTLLLGHGAGSQLLPALDLAEMLDQAKKAVDDMAFVGFTETSAHSVLQLQLQFGWDPEEIPHVNAAPASSLPLNPTFLDWLKEAVRFDHELYEHAAKRWGLETRGTNIPR